MRTLSENNSFVKKWINLYVIEFFLNYWDLNEYWRIATEQWKYECKFSRKKSIQKHFWNWTWKPFEIWMIFQILYNITMCQARLCVIYSSSCKIIINHLSCLFRKWLPVKVHFVHSHFNIILNDNGLCIMSKYVLTQCLSIFKMMHIKIDANYAAVFNLINMM